MNINTKIQNLRKQLLEICDNVQDYFVYPDEYANLQSKFPYITFIIGDFESINSNSQRFVQNINIIGIVKAEEKLLNEQILNFRSKIFNQLYKNEYIDCIIERGSNSNLFKPFGLDAGLYPPYAGTRFELKIPFSFGG